jgi:hypothetical protein
MLSVYQIDFMSLFKQIAEHIIKLDVDLIFLKILELSSLDVDLTSLISCSFYQGTYQFYIQGFT